MSFKYSFKYFRAGTSLMVTSKASTFSGDWRHCYICYVDLEGPSAKCLLRRYDWIARHASMYFYCASAFWTLEAGSLAALVKMGGIICLVKLGSCLFCLTRF